MHTMSTRPVISVLVWFPFKVFCDYNVKTMYIDVTFGRNYSSRNYVVATFDID